MILLLPGDGSGSAYPVEALPHPFFQASGKNNVTVCLSPSTCPHPRSFGRLVFLFSRETSSDRAIHRSASSPRGCCKSWPFSILVLVLESPINPIYQHFQLLILIIIPRVPRRSLSAKAGPLRPLRPHRPLPTPHSLTHYHRLLHPRFHPCHRPPFRLSCLPSPGRACFLCG